jgi:cobalt-zinc-cadmium efflux system membrane fusion protein
MKNACVAIAASLALVGCSRSRPETTPSGEAAGDSRVAVREAEAQERFGMKVSPAKRERLSEYLQVVGTVQPASSRVAQLRPLARGRVLEVMARIGDRVTAGQPLARFDNVEAGELAAQRASARADLNRLKVQVAARSTLARRAAESRHVRRRAIADDVSARGHRGSGRCHPAG